MSKATLKKELKTFDADQLREIILDLYSARKEAKEYLEFFMNPDVEGLLEKTKKEVSKEINRTKRGMLIPRWTKIRASIKKVESLNVGPEHVIGLMKDIFVYAVIDYANYYVSPSYFNGVLVLLSNIMNYGDKNCVLDTVLPTILKYIDLLDSSKVNGRKHSARLLKETVEAYRPSMKA